MTRTGDGMDSKVAVVTGAAQGIGAAVVQTLLRHGVVVAAVDSNAERLSALVGELAPGHKLEGHVADVRDSRACDELMETVERSLGPVDILVNVAGVLRVGSVVEQRDEDWAAVFDVNVLGVLHCSRAAARRMIPRRSGVIVTVSSNAARVPRANMAGYASSKAAASMLTKCLGLELAGYGIRCNIVAPGSTDTEMQRSLWSGPQDRSAVIEGSPAIYRVGVPLRRIAEPSDIADAVLFLVSDQARHITMHELCVDGGAALGA
jgi:2,3-dihydro-2,3-dihydroxybenzoate dehydrogenase